MSIGAWVPDYVALDRAIDNAAEDAFAFLMRLVSEPSTLGSELSALAVFSGEVERLGFVTRQVVVPSEIGDDYRAGVPQQVPGDRYDVLATLGPRSGRPLLLNGHIDVVPAESPHRWSSPPFEPRREGQCLYGRGTGDMKGGFAMATLALRALLDVCPEFLTGPLQFLAVVEEECTGNGTLAAARKGVLAEAVVLLEPTDLGIMLGGVGVLWSDITVTGRSAHAESAHLAVNPVALAHKLIDGLQRWSTHLRSDYPDPTLDADASPYNLNVGQIYAGDWPSSVPTEATVRVRVGFPRAWSADDAEKALRAAVLDIVQQDTTFLDEPLVRMSGFRAPGYLLADDHPLTQAMASAHHDAHGTTPRTFSLGSTTDARIYLNYFDVPALCYGPKAANIHGVDEFVDLHSIVAGARTLARFLINWYRS